MFDLRLFASLILFAAIFTVPAIAKPHHRATATQPPSVATICDPFYRTGDSRPEQLRSRALVAITDLERQARANPSQSSKERSELESMMASAVLCSDAGDSSIHAFIRQKKNERTSLVAHNGRGTRTGESVHNNHLSENGRNRAEGRRPASNGSPLRLDPNDPRLSEAATCVPGPTCPNGFRIQ